MGQRRHELIVLPCAGCLDGTEKIHADAGKIRLARIGITLRGDGSVHGIQGGIDVRLLTRKERIPERFCPRHLLEQPPDRCTDQRFPDQVIDAVDRAVDLRCFFFVFQVLADITVPVEKRVLEVADDLIQPISDDVSVREQLRHFLIDGGDQSFHLVVPDDIVVLDRRVVHPFHTGRDRRDPDTRHGDRKHEDRGKQRQTQPDCPRLHGAETAESVLPLANGKIRLIPPLLIHHRDAILKPRLIHPAQHLPHPCAVHDKVGHDRRRDGDGNGEPDQKTERIDQGKNTADQHDKQRRRGARGNGKKRRIQPRFKTQAAGKGSQRIFQLHGESPFTQNGYSSK